VTGIIRSGTGSRGAFFLQPGDPGFQVAYPLAKTMQLGSHALVRPADVAEESLRHNAVPPTWLKRIPCHRTQLQTGCIACGGEMEKSTSSSPLLRLVSTAAGDSEASWPPPERSPGGGQRGIWRMPAERAIPRARTV
jgi:hypothetical protein